MRRATLGGCIARGDVYVAVRCVGHLYLGTESQKVGLFMTFAYVARLTAMDATGKVRDADTLMLEKRI